jgi:CheY-like chemotaxis protein
MELLDKKIQEAEPMAQQFCDKPGVLVVDDEYVVRMVVQLGLQRSGFEVWLASNGAEAIDLYRAHQEEIALVLLDVRMPGLNGFQTLDAMRELNPDVVACFMSGNTESYEPDGFVQRGAACFIAKPFRFDDLANTLRGLTQGVSADLLLAVR